MPIVDPRPVQIAAQPSPAAPGPYRSYEEFWPFYVSQHQDPTCRALHFVGTSLVWTLLVLALALGAGWPLLVAPVVGYGFAWVGHFAFEHNRPATFTYPLWSLRADFRLHRRLLLGQPLCEIVDRSEAGPSRASSP